MSTWVPEEQRDTSWYLFHKKFRCRVSNIKTMSMDYVKTFGMPTVGDPVHDTQMANELVDRMLSINQMLEYHREGVDILVCKYSDTKEIYERISDHLSAWKRTLETSYSTRGAPIEDLIELDKFANVVYKHAKFQFTQEYVDSILARSMGNHMRVNRSNIMAQKPTVITINKIDEHGREQISFTEEVPVKPERNSMEEALKAYTENAQNEYSSMRGGGGNRWR